MYLLSQWATWRDAGRVPVPCPAAAPAEPPRTRASACGVLCRTPADFRNGFTFRKHQRFCISLASSAFSWSWAFVPDAVKRHEERRAFPASSGLLHIFFPTAIYSAPPQRSVLSHTSLVWGEARSAPTCTSWGLTLSGTCCRSRGWTWRLVSGVCSHLALISKAWRRQNHLNWGHIVVSLKILLKGVSDSINTQQWKACTEI